MTYARSKFYTMAKPSKHTSQGHSPWTTGKLASGIYKLNITQSGRTLKSFKLDVQ